MTTLAQSVSRLINRETWLDQAAMPVQKAINQIFRSSSGRKIGDFLNGSWLGHPVHPVLTDVPIGAWTAAITLDAMEAGSGSHGMAKAADTAVAIGVAGAVGSAISGLADWQYTAGETRRTGFLHATLNTIALGLFISSMVARGNRNRGTGQSLALLGYTVAAVSAYLGGDMVYRQKMGVDHAPEEEVIETKGFVPVIALDQLAEDRPTIAMLTNIPLVVVRRGDQVYALAETCAHLGGPLADGKLVEGPDGHPVVVCPWHGSHFDMVNGDIIQGPSAYPQPCFETRIVDGQVEVRHQPAEE